MNIYIAVMIALMIGFTCGFLSCATWVYVVDANKAANDEVTKNKEM